MDLNLPPIYDGQVQNVREVTIWCDEEDEAHDDVGKVVYECHVCSEDPQAAQLFVLRKSENQSSNLHDYNNNFHVIKASVDVASLILSIRLIIKWKETLSSGLQLPLMYLILLAKAWNCQNLLMT